jgi:hypothetical protein
LQLRGHIDVASTRAARCGRNAHDRTGRQAQVFAVVFATGADVSQGFRDCSIPRIRDVELLPGRFLVFVQ